MLPDVDQAQCRARPLEHEMLDRLESLFDLDRTTLAVPAETV